ncbi:MAG: hypothetical protein WDN04_16600 [Rhodospirillales bacterium]
MEYANLKLVDHELEDQTAVHAQSAMPRPELYQPAPQVDHDRRSLDGELLRYLLRSLGTPPLRIELWNGDVVVPDDGKYVATAKIANRLTLGKLFLDPEYQFGECYSDGSMEFEGDMVAFFHRAISHDRRRRAARHRAVRNVPPARVQYPVRLAR